MSHPLPLGSIIRPWEFRMSSRARLQHQQIPNAQTRVLTLAMYFSFEFFMWPSYMTNITPPLQCIDHFSQLYGKKMPIRIGGTTQDRATYDPHLDGYVSYHVDDPLDAPMNLTYGPKFFDFISKHISCEVSRNRRG